MKNIKRISSLALVALVLVTCVNPVDFEPIPPDDIIIVEGFIDNDFGPHEIRISLLSSFTGVLNGGSTTIVDNAQVTIIDDLGNYTFLENETLTVEDLFNANPMGCSPAIGTKEITTNYFTPESFRGTVGRSYMLEIKLPTRTFRSTMQKIEEPVSIDSVFVEFATLPNEETGVNVFASFEDPVDDVNFYYWQLDGIFNAFTPPSDDPLICCLYDPRDDLGSECWVTETNINADVVVSQDLELNGSTIKNVGFVQDDGLRFTSNQVSGDMQYYVIVKQYIVSKDVFDFYSNVEILAEINGELFDPPPVSVPSNIFNIDSPDERVVGVFGAYSKFERGVFIKRSDLETIKNNNVCGDCRFFQNGDTEIPEVYR